MKKKTGQLFVRPIKLSEGKAPKEIQVFPMGEWDHPAYGKFSLDERDFDDFIRNFEDGVRNDIPITEGHAVMGEDKPAVGWFKELFNRGSDGLWATVEWTEEGKELLRKKSYKYFSPEFYDKYEDPETRKMYRNVLVGGALTNSPYFKELSAVILSETHIINPSDNHMNLKEILKKQASELNDEEKAFLREHKEELSADDQKKFSEVLAGGEGDDPEPASDPAPAPAAMKEAKEPVQAGMIQMSEAEVKLLRDKADQGAKAMEEVRKMQFSTEVQGLIFSEANKKGKIAPKSKDKVVAFMLSLKDDQLMKFREIVTELPDAMNFTEVGDGGKTETDVAQEFSEAVKAKMEDGKMKYSEAVTVVAQENPDLVNRYNEAYQPA